MIQLKLKLVLNHRLLYVIMNAKNKILPPFSSVSGAFGGKFLDIGRQALKCKSFYRKKCDFGNKVKIDCHKIGQSIFIAFF